MHIELMESFAIDHIEIYTPMAKPLVYWHNAGLGFAVEGYKGTEAGSAHVSSYVLRSGSIRLVLSSTYSTLGVEKDAEIAGFLSRRYSGVKRVVLQSRDVQGAFDRAVSSGAIPVRGVQRISDDKGYVELASVALFGEQELGFIDRSHYKGSFLPGFKPVTSGYANEPRFTTIDHIASELRTNEIGYWSHYLSKAVGAKVVQEVGRSGDNRTGMIMNICQTDNKALTMVMSEPMEITGRSKIKDNLDIFGPGIHHLAFATEDIVSTVDGLLSACIEVVGVPDSYYDLLREEYPDSGLDIDTLQKFGILMDKEEDSFLLQKFIRPYGDQPFFFYEIVQRVNGYNGFALKNINVLKRAEERELAKIG
ncbi:MAG TPA: VOC family protein [Puia sp.]|nr:VOC family protein [Puia sp.]